MGMGKRQRIKLGILFGGRSGEHEVSLTSAASVISALDPHEFDISAFGVTKSGCLASASETRKMLPASLHSRVEIRGYLDAPHSRVRFLPSSNRKGTGSNSAPEIVFPLLHGPYGEDGTIQGLLETTGVPYIGCGVLASAVAMDKDLMKRIFLQEQLPILPHMVVPSRDLRVRIRSLKRTIRKEFGYPVFSKPANLGSSVGVRKVHSERELEEAALYSAQFDAKIIVEKGIDARELEVAILGNSEPRASVVGEVIPSNEFYDYEAKYHDPDLRFDIPAHLAAGESEIIRKLALRAFKAIEGSGLARVDFFMERNSGTVYVNEINTMPGFTPISMYAKLWSASGVPFDELIRSLVELGFERFRERRSFKISPEEP